MFGGLADIRGALDAVAQADASELSGHEALAAMGQLGAIRAIVDALTASVAVRVNETGAYLFRGDRDAAHTIARSLGVGAGEARRVLDSGNKLAELPAVAAEVRSGQISMPQAALIADAAQHNPAAQDRLLEKAADGLVPLRDACIAARAEVEHPDERSKRQRAERHFRMWTTAEGMTAGHFEVTPEIGGQIKAIVDDGVQKTFRSRRAGEEHEPHEAYAADVLADTFLGDRKTKGVKANVHIVADHAVLVRGNREPGERCEIPGVGPVNVEWVRELLGDAMVTLVVEKGVDLVSVTHLGRHIPAEIRTALIVGGRECDHPGCHNRGYLEIDHIEEYAKGGATAYWNLRWLCWIHHRRRSRLAHAS